MSEFDYRNRERKSGYFKDEDFIQSPKKFVFQILPENVKYIEDLTYQEKQDFINQLITNDRLANEQYYQRDAFWKSIRKAVIAVVIILVIIPILFFLFNFSISTTQKSYHEMEQNFAKLYH